MERQFLVFRILEKAFGVPVAVATYTSRPVLSSRHCQGKIGTANLVGDIGS